MVQMILETISIDYTIEFLNNLAADDPEFMRLSIAARVPCNEITADHPSVQVAVVGDPEDSEYNAGFLGVLNGLFGSDEDAWGVITMVYDNDDDSLSFRRTIDSDKKRSKEKTSDSGNND